ncbi:hypothetical protein BC940DRAFT_288975 [Gongronella butleri]|nr:hypothetical protein BC940DRAFT_288975 [Gongronella butleri]
MYKNPLILIIQTETNALYDFLGLPYPPRDSTFLLKSAFYDRMTSANRFHPSDIGTHINNMLEIFGIAFVVLNCPVRKSAYDRAGGILVDLSWYDEDNWLSETHRLWHSLHNYVPEPPFATVNQVLRDSVSNDEDLMQCDDVDLQAVVEKMELCAVDEVEVSMEPTNEADEADEVDEVDEPVQVPVVILPIRSQAEIRRTEAEYMRRWLQERGLTKAPFPWWEDVLQ